MEGDSHGVPEHKTVSENISKFDQLWPSEKPAASPRDYGEQTFGRDLNSDIKTTEFHEEEHASPPISPREEGSAGDVLSSEMFETRLNPARESVNPDTIVSN